VRFLADECVDAALVVRLRAAGHDVRHLAESERGLTDAAVLELALRERRVLVTEDKDFGELAFRGALAATGIILLRIDPSLRRLKWARLEATLARLGDRLLGRYTVVHPDRIRSRPLPY
jgi:predicted nuclease of predicted toxin-antitoxin system